LLFLHQEVCFKLTFLRLPLVKDFLFAKNPDTARYSHFFLEFKQNILTKNISKKERFLFLSFSLIFRLFSVCLLDMTLPLFVDCFRFASRVLCVSFFFTYIELFLLSVFMTNHTDKRRPGLTWRSNHDSLRLFGHSTKVCHRSSSVC
jgi:hypothetical protein